MPRSDGAYTATIVVLVVFMIMTLFLTTFQGQDASAQSSGTVPGVPTGVCAVPGNEKVTVNWTAPRNTGGSTINGYNVYRGEVQNMLSYIGTSMTSSYVDNGLTNGQMYYYSVTAVNGVGESGRSAEVSVTPAAVPGTPIDPTAVASDGQASLGWSAPYSNGGTPVLYYNIYRGSASNMEIYLTSVSATSFLNLGLTDGQMYYYEISAVNSVGEGPRSVEVSAIDAMVPGTISFSQVTPANGMVTLTWNPPGNTGGSPIKGYDIYRGSVTGQEMFYSTVTGTTFTDPSLTNGRTYYYYITAVNNVGEGPRSVEVSATPVTTPNAPSALIANAGSAQVTLNWTAPAVNGGSTVTYYRVYRSTSKGEEVFLSNSFSTSYIDNDLTDNVTYYYEVSAVNAIGEGPMSAEVSAKPGDIATTGVVLTTNLTYTSTGAIVAFNLANGTNSDVYRYDWIWDGVWDTGWEANTTYEHDYLPGNYTALVQVYDEATQQTTTLHAEIVVPGEVATTHVSSGGGIPYTIIFVLCGVVGGLLVLRFVLKRRGG